MDRNGWQPFLCGELRNPLDGNASKRVRANDETASGLFGQDIDGHFYVGGTFYGDCGDVLRCRFSRGFDLAKKIAVKRSSPWIVHYGSLREVWRHILQQVCPFPNQFRVYIGEAGNVAARMRETFYKPEADRIVHERTND